MVDVRVRTAIASEDVAAVRALADAATAADGRPPFGDAVWRDLEHPSTGSALVVAEAGDSPVGALYLTPQRPDGARRLVAAAVVVEPRHRTVGVAHALVEAAVAHVRATGGGHLVLWAYGADNRADSFARAAGFAPERELWQMRIGLPLAGQPAWPPDVTVRTFVPRRDETEWLAVNNRAFAADPDQGGWSEQTLRQREAEPWFDPDGFLLAYAPDGLAGFCWTKIHPPAPPAEPTALGEIYVIGVDPARQGTGLGRALTVAGLATLFERGTPVGMLFVDAANTPAVPMYRSLGFELSRVDRAYGQEVS